MTCTLHLGKSVNWSLLVLYELAPGKMTPLCDLHWDPSPKWTRWLLIQHVKHGSPCIWHGGRSFWQVPPGTQRHWGLSWLPWSWSGFTGLWGSTGVLGLHLLFLPVTEKHQSKIFNLYHFLQIKKFATPSPITHYVPWPGSDNILPALFHPPPGNKWEEAPCRGGSLTSHYQLEKGHITYQVVAGVVIWMELSPISS